MSSETVLLSEYISRARRANTHVAKQVVLADLLRDVSGLN